MKKLLSLILLYTSAAILFAAPGKDLWPKWKASNPANSQTINHDKWNQFLKTYVTKSGSGINLVRYSKVTQDSKELLKSYIRDLQNIKITDYKRAEQMAFWINLYNSLTVKVILDHYPVKTILDIDLSSGLFANGPWDKKLVIVEREKISLNDIEHRILRPIWNDNRIHYAVNCASMGCPNLSSEAFDGENLEKLLNQGAVDYINHPRGIKFDEEDIIASKIFDWYSEDFGDNEEKLINHWIRFAKPDLARKLRSFDEDIDYEYDWDLNETER